MSKDVYEQSDEMLELYSLIEEGLEEEQQGKVRPFSEALEEIREDMNSEWQQHYVGADSISARKITEICAAGGYGIRPYKTLPIQI